MQHSTYTAVVHKASGSSAAECSGGGSQGASFPFCLIQQVHFASGLLSLQILIFPCAPHPLSALACYLFLQTGGVLRPLTASAGPPDLHTAARRPFPLVSSVTPTVRAQRSPELSQLRTSGDRSTSLACLQGQGEGGRGGNTRFASCAAPPQRRTMGYLQQPSIPAGSAITLNARYVRLFSSLSSFDSSAQLGPVPPSQSKMAAVPAVGAR